MATLLIYMVRTTVPRLDRAPSSNGVHVRFRASFHPYDHPFSTPSSAQVCLFLFILRFSGVVACLSQPFAFNAFCIAWSNTIEYLKRIVYLNSPYICIYLKLPHIRGAADVVKLLRQVRSHYLVIITTPKAFSRATRPNNISTMSCS